MKSMSVTRETLAERVSRAMADAGMTQAELAAAIGINASALSRALSGQRNFKSLEVGLIAQTLQISTEYLLADEEPPPALLAARAQPDANPSLAPALARVEQFLDLDGLLVNLGFAATAGFEPPAADSHLPYEQGEALASQLRAEIGCQDNDLPYDLSDLAELLESKLGIDIAFESLPGGLDGLSIIRGGFRLALVASNVSATRQRFTLGHELGHLAMGDSQDLHIDENVVGRKTDGERRANAFAAAFLMPRKAIEDSLSRGYVSEEVVAQLLGRFGVSLDALAFRLHNVGVANATVRERIRSMSSSRIALRRGRVADLQARNDRRAPGNLLLRAAEAYVAGKISIRPLAQLLRVDPEQLLDELSPPQHQPANVDVDLAALEPAL